MKEKGFLYSRSKWIFSYFFLSFLLNSMPMYDVVYGTRVCVCVFFFSTPRQKKNTHDYERKYILGIANDICFLSISILTTIRELET